MAVPGINERKFRQSARNVDRALRALERSIGRGSARKVFRTAFKEHSAPMVDEAKQRVRKNRGALARTINMRFSQPKGARRKRGPKAIFQAFFGYVVGRAKSPKRFTSINQALAVEYGTKHQPATRAVRRAFDSHIQAALARTWRDVVAAMCRDAQRASGHRGSRR